MRLHICTENPCPVRDKECVDVLNNGFTINYVSEQSDKITHWACPKMIKKYGGAATCCECDPKEKHECEEKTEGERNTKREAN